MAFPTVSATTNANAQAAFQSACSAAGLQLNTLSGLSQVQLALANLLDYDPTTSDVPAGNIVAGTFGANTATPTGAYTFSGNVTIGTAKFVVTAATGAFTASSTATLGGATNPILVGRLADVTSYGVVSFNGDISTAAAVAGLVSRVADTTLYGMVPTGWNYDFRINNIQKFTLTATQATFATPLAIAGALTGVTTLNMTTQPAFVAGSKYLVISAGGDVQVSATGPAS